MQLSLSASLVALGLASMALAQSQTIVSPVGTATVDGNSSNNFPWIPTTASSTPRYMQIHSDLGNTPKLIQKIAFRRQGTAATQAGTRAVDLELYMGSSVDYDRCSWVYANNWIGTPTKVLSRQVINIGPYAAAGNPAPFEITIPISIYVHVGTTSLAWDAQIYGNVESPPMTSMLDTDTSSAAFGVASPITGAGCLATGQSTAMSLVLQHHDSGGTYLFGGYVDFAPANAPLFLALGTSNPNLSVPGLCGNLYTDLAVVLMLGLTDASGFFGVTAKNGTTITKVPGGPLAFAFANVFSGQTLYLQAHAVDSGSTLPIPIANSNGRSLTIPNASLTKVARVTRLFHTNGPPNAPWAAFQAPAALAIKVEPITVGYGVVTEFTY